MEIKDLYKKLQNEKFIISGPCVIENETMVMRLAEKIKVMTDDLKFTYIFIKNLIIIFHSTLHITWSRKKPNIIFH